MSKRALIIVRRGARYLSTNVCFDGSFDLLGAELALNFPTRESALFLTQFSDLKFVDSGVVEVPKRVLQRGLDFFLSQRDLFKSVDLFRIKYIYLFDTKHFCWKAAQVETLREEKSLKKAFSRDRARYDRAVRNASKKARPVTFLPKIVLSEKRPLLTRAERRNFAEKTYEERIRIGLKEAYLRHFARCLNWARDEDNLFEEDAAEYALRHLKEVKPLLTERGLKRLQEIFLSRTFRNSKRLRVL